MNPKLGVVFVVCVAFGMVIGMFAGQFLYGLLGGLLAGIVIEGLRKSK